ncbi:MAG: methyltransferase domain-containing protein [Bacteroidales bacterium]|nr:methyltransferase domain-containing protein [Bacteroidales bacterium]
MSEQKEDHFLSKKYWSRQYDNNRTGWDIGYVSPPIKEYFDQRMDRAAKILVPGAGNGWEVEYLYKNGWHNTYLLDFAPAAVQKFSQRFPDFPNQHILEENFFDHQGTYDYVVEQTFFSSIPRTIRPEYARQIFQLLKPGGKFVGLLFNHEFNYPGPPFGGTTEEYKTLFFSLFNVKYFTTAFNSIKPRKDRELFIILEKPNRSKNNFLT